MADDPAATSSLTALYPSSLDVEKVSTYLFAADSAAPRRKRASDVVRFIVMAGVFGLLAWTAANEPPIDVTIFDATTDFPSWLRFFGWVGYTGSLLVMVGLLIVMLIRGGIGRGVLRDVGVTLALIVTFGVIAGQLSTDGWPSLVAEFDDDSRLTFPTLRTSIVLSSVWVLAPYVTAPVQRAFRWTAWAAVLSPLLLSLTTFTSLLGAIALAAGAVAGVRLLFGSPEGLPPVNRLADTLRRAGVDARDLAYLPDQPGTVGLATADGPDGRRYSIKIYGEDAARSQSAERAWRAMWYRHSGPMVTAGRLEQAQNESLAIAFCQISGVGAPELVAGGQDISGDVVVVSLDPDGRGLGSLEPSRVDGELMTAMWAALTALHRDVRISHGRIAPDSIWVDANGAVSFVDFQQASTLPTEQQLAVDVASLLASTAVLVGSDAAVEGAVSGADRELLVAALPFVQVAAIDPNLRRDVKQAGLKMDDLRSALASSLGIEEPEPAPIRRVSTKNIVMAVFAIIAANALISQIADVGFDTLLDELRNASTGWLVAAFIVKMLSYSTAYIGLRAVIAKPIPFAPTTLLQSAKSYVGLVVPTMVGRVGLDIRFLQKQGVSTTVAATQGPVISLIGFVSEITLLLFSAWAIGQDMETDDLLAFDSGGLLVLIVALVVIGIVVVLAVPKLRHAVLPVVGDAIDAAKTIIASPTTLAQVYGSELLDRLFGALALGCTVAAFGVDLGFTSLIFVSVGTGLLAGLAPVPGGIGVAEATMSALLTAVGVDPALSVSIAIVHRVVTSYLPPVLGFFSLNWLTDESYL
jgi:uncharacterized membrane protein YbhN (UPF0104 family)